MGRTLEQIMENLPEEHRIKIEARSELLKSVLANETVKRLIEDINQNASLQPREEAYKNIMKRIDALMEMNDGEGPKTDSEDGLLLEVMSEIAEAYESEKFKL